jgi:phosphoenolpyruvate carboxykinase (GTP)
MTSPSAFVSGAHDSPPHSLDRWVRDVSALTTPKHVVYCDGSREERAALIRQSVEAGELIELNQQRLPGCYLHRSAPHDVARAEDRSVVCTRHEEDAGPNNAWMAPEDARRTLHALFRGAMTGRTMYVVPFAMGPTGSRFAKAGIQITDSRYAVLQLSLLNRVGQAAFEEAMHADAETFVRCVHSLGDLDPARRLVVHCPDAREVWSIGSGFGGNALLSKKCAGLRLASWFGRDEGWLAENMLLVGLRRPDGRTFYLAGGYPAACGGPNFAMLGRPASLPGWTIETLGDDIVWLRPGADGRLWAINPETGFFDIVSGLNRRTNPTAWDMIQRDAIYTNVALRPDGTPWWEGHHDPPPNEALDWRGQPWTPASGRPAAHPNCRFTSAAERCATLSPRAADPQGVPLDAIVFGARRQHHVPLVCQARDWRQGIFFGAMLASETTPAATGHGSLDRSELTPKWPLCGYNLGDYWAHWLSIGRGLTQPPAVFRVNWQRSAPNGAALWPNPDDSLRALPWMLARCAGEDAAARETIAGAVPAPDAIDMNGRMPADVLQALLAVHPPDWRNAARAREAFFNQFGARLPGTIREEHQRLANGHATPETQR